MSDVKQLSALVDRLVFVMAMSSANDIVEQLENFLKILKEEQVFNQSSDHSVIRFLHPKDLQVNNSLISYNVLYQ